MKKVFVLLVVTLLMNSLTACSKQSNKMEFYKGEPSLYVLSSPDKSQGRAYAIFTKDTVAMAYKNKTAVFDYTNDESSITLTNNGEKKKLSLRTEEKFNGIQVLDPDNNDELIYTFHSARQDCKKRMIGAITDNSNYEFITSDDGISDLLISNGKFHVSRFGKSIMEADYTLDENILKLSFEGSTVEIKIRVEPLDSYDFVLYDVNDDKNFIILHTLFAGGGPVCKE